MVQSVYTRTMPNLFNPTTIVEGIASNINKS